MATTETSTSPSPAVEDVGTTMLSPNAMAQAVLDSAIAEHDRQLEQTTETACMEARSNKRPHLENDHNFKDAREKLKQVWEDSDKEAAVDATLTLVHGQIASLIHSGLEVHHSWENANRDLSQAKEECEAKDRELRRLRLSEEQSRATITNLLKTVEATKSDVRDVSRIVQVEARLRAELSHLRMERNDALAQAAESKRKSELLEEEVRTMKAKYSKVVQEKIKMERESRAAMSLARSIDTHASSDCDFYKRKATELTNSLQTQQALVAEQKSQIEEMRRQMERTMSQNRLANIRAETEKGRKRGS